MQLNKRIFRSQQLQKYLTYVAFFFSKLWKINVDSKKKTKERKKLTVFKTISFELVTVNNLYS